MVSLLRLLKDGRPIGFMVGLAGLQTIAQRHSALPYSLSAAAGTPLALHFHVLSDDLPYLCAMLIAELSRLVCHLAIKWFDPHIGLGINHGQENNAKLNELVVIDSSAVSWLNSHAHCLSDDDDSDPLNAQTSVRTNKAA
eukprot:4637647-Amphidinium_carterae.1